MTFKSKIDSWLIIFIAVALLAAPVLIVLNPHAPRNPSTMGNGTLIAIVLLATALPVALITWIFTTTEYTVTETDLVVRSGPMSQKIALASIKKIVKTRSLWSAPALSLDRIEVQYGTFGTIVISPDDKTAFARAIRSRVPAVIVEEIVA